MTRTARMVLLVAITLISVLIIFSFPAVPQDRDYHNFADQRALWGIPHFADVLSNLPFILVGFWGLWVCRKVAGDPSRMADARERFPLWVIFSGIVMVGFGSAYYHVAPSNETLLWDRLPIALVIMAVVAMILCERWDVKTGILLLGPLLLLGLASVMYWQATELAGQGDLRFYGFVMLYPILLIPLLVVLFPPRHTGMGYLYQMLGLHVIAKLFEFMDRSIFEMLRGLMSGHTLKHLFAAGAICSLIFYIQKRRLIARKI